LEVKGAEGTVEEGEKSMVVAQIKEAPKEEKISPSSPPQTPSPLDSLESPEEPPVASQVAP